MFEFFMGVAVYHVLIAAVCNQEYLKSCEALDIEPLPMHRQIMPSLMWPKLLMAVIRGS